MSARAAKILRRSAFCAVAISLIVLSGGLVWPLGNNPVFSFMMFGTCLIHLATGPKWKEIAATAALAELLHTAYGARFGFASYFGSWWINWGGFTGLASLAVMLFQLARSRGEERKTRTRNFLIAGSVGYTWIVIALSLGTITHTPRSFDSKLLAFDSTLGFQPSFWLGSLLIGHPFWQGVTRTIYNALPLGGSSLLAWHVGSKFRPVKLIPLYVTLMVLGFCSYGIYPAAGPIFPHPGVYPLHPPALSQILADVPQPFDAPRNAMPSLHFGAMLVLVWNSRRWSKWARAAAFAFLAGIAFSTLSLGEHYLIDLVVAFPFVMAAQAAWTTSIPLRDPRRYQPMAAGAVAVVVWLSALRWAIPVFLAGPPLAWCSMIVTVAGSIWLERRLAEVAWREPAVEVAAAEPVAMSLSVA